MVTKNLLDHISQSFDSIEKELREYWPFPNFNYPKVDLIKTEDGKFRFEFAVAGFDKSELNVEVGPTYISVSGQPSKEAKNYIWKNISSKPFNIQIKVPDVTKIGTPELVNGILSFTVGEPDVVKPKKLDIK